MLLQILLRRFREITPVVIFLSIAPVTSAEQTLFWLGGSGNWNTSTTNWGDGLLMRAWTQEYEARFTTTSGTVNLTQDIRVQRITITQDGYIFNGNSTITLIGSGRAFDVTTGTSTINSKIIGTLGLTKSGSGTLILGGDNSFSGAINLNIGGLQLASSDRLPDSSRLIMLADTEFRLDGFSETVGDLSGNGSIYLSGGTLQVGSSSLSRTYSGNIFGGSTSNFIKNGNGTLTFTSSITSGGTFTINAGKIAIDGEVGAGFNSNADLVIAGGIFDLNTHNQSLDFVDMSAGSILGTATLTANAFDFSNSGDVHVPLSGNARLTKSGGGTLILRANNSYSGNTKIDAGTLSLQGSGQLPNTTKVTIGSGAELNLGVNDTTIASVSGSGALKLVSADLTLSGSDSASYSGIISGNGGLTKSGSGSQTLTNTHTFSGDTVVSGGSLILGHATNTLPNSSDLTITGGSVNLETNSDQIAALTVNSGSLTGSGTLTASSHTFTNSASVSVALAGSGGLTKSGEGVVSLSGRNTYSGTTTINAGTLRLDHATNTLPNNNQVIISGGALDLGSNSDSIGTLTLHSGAITGTGTLSPTAIDIQNSGTISASLGGNTSLIKNGSGTVTLNGTNSYSQQTLILGGKITLGHATNTLPDSTAVTISAGTELDMGGNSDTIGSLNLSGGTLLGGGQLSAATFTASSGTISSDLTGTGSLIKNGTGTVTLSSSSTYSGDTTISAGTLRLGVDDALSNSTDVIVETNAIFDLNNHTDRVRSLSGAGDITLGSGTLNAGANSDTTFSGTISGTGDFGKRGSGTLTLSGENTYSGGTKIVSGVLSFGGGGSQGSLVGDVINNATLQFNRSNSVSFPGIISGTGGVVKKGAGELSLTTTQTYTGGTVLETGTLVLGHATDTLADTGSLTVNGGTLKINNATDTIGTLTFSGGNIQGNGTLTGSSYAISNSGDESISAKLAGAVGLTKTESGTITLNGTHTFTGATTINGGTLKLGNDDTLSNSSDVTIGAAGTLAVNNKIDRIRSISGAGSITLGSGSLLAGASNDTTFSGVISGSGDFDKRGSGTLILTNDQTYTGGTKITSGTLQIGDGGPAGSIVGDVINNRNLAFNRSNNLNFAGDISGTGDLIKNGNGALTLSGSNTYSGDTNVNAGTLRIGAANALSPHTTLHVAPGATFNPNGFAQRVARLSGTGDIDVGTGGLTVEPTSTNTFSGRLTGTGGLIKNGAGDLELSGTHTYSGQTRINAGRIKLTGSAASSAFHIENGGTLAGTGTLGSLTLASGGTLAPGASPGTLNAGDTIWNGGATFDFEIDNAIGSQGTNWDLLAITGTLTINAIAGNQFTLNIDTLLNGTNNAGAMANFDADTTQSWTFATTTGGITFGENASVGASFALVTTGFANATNGSFSISQIGNNIALIYTTSAVPEPSSFAFMAGLTGLAFTLIRRRRSSSNHI